MKFLLKGKSISKKEAAGYPIIAKGPGLGTKDVAYAFDSEGSFRDWAKGTKFADKVSDIMRAILKAKQYDERDITDAIKRQGTAAKRIIKDLKDLASRTGLELGSKELFLRATSRTNPLEPPILHSALLYRHVNFGGSIFPLAPLFPYAWLPWFDDEASSIRGHGICVLCEHPRYRGRAIWFFGSSARSGFFEDSWLGASGFNDMASSAYVWPL